MWPVWKANALCKNLRHRPHWPVCTKSNTAIAKHSSRSKAIYRAEYLSRLSSDCRWRGTEFCPFNVRLAHAKESRVPQVQALHML